LETENGIVVLHSAAPTIGQALLEAGYELHEADFLSPSADTPLTGPMAVEYQPARRITIEVDGTRVRSYAVGPTVGEALSQAGVALVGLDYSQPELGEPLPEDGQLSVVRVREEVKLELEPVPFDVEYQPVADVELDQLQVIDNGTYGVMARRVRVRYENGQEIDQEIENAVVIVDPEPRVLGYGTQIVVRTLSTADGVIEYWRAVEVYATAYSPCNLGVPWCGYTTASGSDVKRGVVGVIRSWYNVMQGMPVYVPGYGYGSIEDIGGGIAGRHWVDLGFTDENIEPWHNWTTIYFLTPVPSPDRILYILP
jgi:3D (Asp-Asp-Asp) domain-containing protein